MEFGIIIKPCVWLYGESLKHAIDELFMGWAIGILEEMDGWCKVVTHYGYHGYLEKGTFLSFTVDELKIREKSRQTVFVKRMQADIMAEPDVHSEIICTLERGSFLTVLPEKKSGYQAVLLSDGRKGYIACIAYSCRKDSDRYLYEENVEDYFLRQHIVAESSETLFRKQLIEYARGYLGIQYRWAGKSAQGIDCSGLVFMCYLMNGVLIYRDAVIKAEYPVHEISMKQAKPGDLLYFQGHVAMYIGNRKFIHATGNEKSFGCVINSLSADDPDFREDLADSFLMAGSIV